MMRSAASLLDELRSVDESSLIEAKTGSQIDRAVMQTVCAFANEPGQGGGYLLLGVRPSSQLGLFNGDYEVVGVADTDKMQSDLASQCASVFNKPMRPRIAVETLNGRNVVVVFVPELAPTDKPLFVKNLGLPRGAYRRVGPTDQEGTEDDLVALYQGHQGEAYDGSVLRDADLHDLDPEAIRVYRELRREANPDAEELTWTDPDLLRALGAVVTDDGTLRPTVAGVLLFGTSQALRRCFPMMRVDYVRVSGREWVADPDRRFDTVEIRAPLLIAARRAITTVREDLPASFRLPEGEATRSDETRLPVRVLREAIVNALMHRSYRLHGPIQIIRYANRLEVRNPGHSLKAEEQLGEPGSQTRNPRIAAVMHDVHLAETKGSGIRAMRELMLASDLLPPTLESSRSPDQFVAVFLFHHFLEEDDLTWLRQITNEKLSDEDARALVFVREMGAIDNATFRSINTTDTLQASSHLRRLRDLELLEMKGSGNRTYYVPGKRMLGSHPGVGKGFAARATHPHQVGADPHQEGADPHQVGADPHQVETDPHQVGPKIPGSAEVADASVGLPEDLHVRIAAAGPRPRREAVRSLILEIAKVRPFTARELTGLLNKRDPKQLVREHLAPMVAAGQLAYVIPEMPNHPDQKYTLPAPHDANDANGGNP
jgi:ATP-dependent DNA helicase RecG